MTTTTYRLRELRADPADLDALYDVFVGFEVDDVGTSELTRTDVEQHPTFPVWRAWVAEDAGRAMAAAELMHFPGGDHLALDIRWLPGTDRAALADLLDVALAGAQGVSPELNLHVFVCEHEAAFRAVLAERGGRSIRRFLRMDIDLPKVPATPDPPAGVTVAVSDGGDENLLVFKHIRDASFSEHFGAAVGPDDEWLAYQRRMGPDVSLWWLALVDGEPASALRCRAIGTFGWIDNLGTLSAYRGRGLGSTLLKVAFRELAIRGCTSVGLGVDAGNVTPAVHVYEAAGMRRAHSWLTYLMPR